MSRNFLPPPEKSRYEFESHKNSVSGRNAVTHVIQRSSYFVSYWIASLVIFHHELAGIVDLSWNDNRHTHIVMIPLISVGLLFLKRKSIFGKPLSYGFKAGLPIAALAALFYSLARTWAEPLGDYGDLTFAAAAIGCTWIAGFVFCYGASCAIAAVFPLSFLFLSIPIPPDMVSTIEVSLQNASADVTYLLFHALSIPVFREGLIFSLPRLTIEVAQECSGIRSMISLVIAALLLGHCFLASNWRRAACVALSIPIAIFKNAVRITILSYLGSYVSIDYLHGDLHHRGGPLFSMLSLALLLGLLWLLRIGDHEEPPKKPAPDPVVIAPLMTGNKQKA